MKQWFEKFSENYAHTYDGEFDFIEQDNGSLNFFIILINR